MTRSASPSKARPRSAPCATTSRASSPGSVEPHLSLMFAPSGASDSAVTCAPRSANTRGAMALAAPLAQSTTRRSPLEAPPSERPCQLCPVELHGIGFGADPPHVVAGGPAGRSVGVGQQRVELALDRPLDLDRQFGPEEAEELDAVVAERIVRGRDHGAGHAARLGHRGDAGRGQHAEIHDVRPLGGQPGREGGLEQRARPARVAADDEGRGGQHAGGGTSEGQRQLGRQLLVRNPAHTIGAEAGRRHCILLATAWSTAAPCGPSSGRTSSTPSRGRRG